MTRNLGSEATKTRITNVHCTDDCVVVDLADGRTISVPLAFYPRLLHATRHQRSNWQLAGGGYGIHWPDIDEDLSRSSGLPVAFGHLMDGRLVIVVCRWVDQVTVQPITASEVPE